MCRHCAEHLPSTIFQTVRSIPTSQKKKSRLMLCPRSHSGYECAHDTLLGCLLSSAVDQSSEVGKGEIILPILLLGKMRPKQDNGLFMESVAVRV